MILNNKEMYDIKNSVQNNYFGGNVKAKHLIISWMKFCNGNVGWFGTCSLDTTSSPFSFSTSISKISHF